MKWLALASFVAILTLSFQDGEAAPYDDVFRPPPVAVNCENGEYPSVLKICAVAAAPGFAMILSAAAERTEEEFVRQAESVLPDEARVLRDNS